MTVITKNLNEKKSDNLQEPLVENIVVEHADEGKGKKCDIEAGGYPIPPPHTTRYIVSARVRPYYSLMFILMLVLLVATSLLGIFGTEYLYEQYKYFVGSEPKQEVYRAWGTLSYDEDPSAMAYENRVPARFEHNREPLDENNILSELEKFMKSRKMRIDLEDTYDVPKRDDVLEKFLNSHKLGTDLEETDDVPKREDYLFRKSSESESDSNPSETKMGRTELKEEFELDVEKGIEKINVPAKQTCRFVHDFYANLTAIVDLENERCFIMPLDRNLVVPPKDMFDLIFKMSDGYYSVDTAKIRRDMEVGDRITNTDSLGPYIRKDCENFAIYQLTKKEKFVGGVVKRSAQESGKFVYFNGKTIMEINVDNLPSALPRAIP